MALRAVSVCNLSARVVVSFGDRHERNQTSPQIQDFHQLYIPLSAVSQPLQYYKTKRLSVLHFYFYDDRDCLATLEGSPEMSAVTLTSC